MSTKNVYNDKKKTNATNTKYMKEQDKVSISNFQKREIF